MAFQKGKSGNPGGRKPITEKEKAVNKLTKETFNDLCETMMKCTREEIIELISGKLPYESELFLLHMIDLGEKPDWAKYEKYLSRRIGPIKEEIEHSGKITLEDIVAGSHNDSE